MKSTWTNILPASVLEQGAADPDFALEHTADPDPKDADSEVATDQWKLPPAKPWAPPADSSDFVIVETPVPVSLWTQIKQSKLLGRFR
jgi:hypothetical protein